MNNMARSLFSSRVFSSCLSTLRHEFTATGKRTTNHSVGLIAVCGSRRIDGKVTLFARRCYSSSSSLRELQASDIKIELTKNPMPKPANDSLVFGQQFSDHMLLAEWTEEEGWSSPRIIPYSNFNLAPSASCFHYGIELFEGMKAFRGDDGKIRLFRPMENMKRMNNSAYRASLPAFDGEEFAKCIKELVRIDRDWVPNDNKCSLYIRPTFIGTQAGLGVHKSNRALLFCITGPVGPYFRTGSFNPVSLLADPTYVRAWPGGVGDCKLGGNYGPTILAQRSAEEQGCQQVLWLFGEDHQITEVGTMNIFMHWINEDGVEELVTPPLNGLILPGVTRKSLIELAENWGEMKVTEREFNMSDLIKGLNENRVKELFGAGTACVVCPINRILYKGESIHIPTMENGPKVATRLYNELTGIQYGRIPSDWVEVVQEDEERMTASNPV